MTRLLRRRRHRRSAQAGFTLVELMVSLVMFSFTVAGLLAVAVSMANGFREQRLAVSTEGAARAGMEFLADALRGLSPGVPTGTVYHEASCIPSVLAMTNSAAGPDRLTAVFAYGSVVTSTRTPVLESDPGMTVVDGSQLAAGDTVLVTDFATGHLFEIASITPNAGLYDIVFVTGGCTTSGVAGYPAGSLVIRALHAEFFIQDQDTIPTLMMDPNAHDSISNAEPLAEGIEDMQIAVGIDGATDGISEVEAAGVGADEWVGNVATEVLPIPVPTGLRAIRISLIARSNAKLTGTAAATSVTPGAEDHPAGTTPTPYRYRVLTSTVEIRNLGGSP